MWIKLKIDQNNGKNFTVLNVALKIPEKLKSVIESIGRITGREIDDLCSLLIIDQLNFFRQSEGEVLRYMKDYDTFTEHLAEGLDLYFNQQLK